MRADIDEFDDYPVDPRSDADLERIADEIRKELGFSNEEIPTAVQMLAALQEKRRVEIVVRPDDEMGRKEAYTTSEPARVFFCRSAFERVARDEPRARMTVAHEIFHIYVHPGAPKARMAGGNATANFIKPARSAERQARVGAAAILMPQRIVAKAESAEKLQAKCRVSGQAATIRYDQWRRGTQGRPELPFVRAHLDYLKSLTPQRSAAAATSKIRQAQALWEALDQVQGMDPKAYRLCSQRTFMVAWSEFEKMTQCGWFIRNNEVVASIILERG